MLVPSFKPATSGQAQVTVENAQLSVGALISLLASCGPLNEALFTPSFLTQKQLRELHGQNRKGGREFVLAPSLVLGTGYLSPLKLSWCRGSPWYRQGGVKWDHYRCREWHQHRCLCHVLKGSAPCWCISCPPKALGLFLNLGSRLSRGKWSQVYEAHVHRLDMSFLGIPSRHSAGRERALHPGEKPHLSGWGLGSGIKCTPPK